MPKRKFLGACSLNPECVLLQSHRGRCKLGRVQDEDYEVESIVNERVRPDGSMEYLIKWLGWPIEDCTWEPKAALANAPLVLASWTSRKARARCENPASRRNRGTASGTSEPSSAKAGDGAAHGESTSSRRLRSKAEPDEEGSSSVSSTAERSSNASEPSASKRHSAPLPSSRASAATRADRTSAAPPAAAAELHSLALAPRSSRPLQSTRAAPRAPSKQSCTSPSPNGSTSPPGGQTASVDQSHVALSQPATKTKHPRSELSKAKRQSPRLVEMMEIVEIREIVEKAWSGASSIVGGGTSEGRRQPVDEKAPTAKRKCSDESVGCDQGKRVKVRRLREEKKLQTVSAGEAKPLDESEPHRGPMEVEGVEEVEEVGQVVEEVEEAETADWRPPEGSFFEVAVEDEKVGEHVEKGEGGGDDLVGCTRCGQRMVREVDQLLQEGIDPNCVRCGYDFIDSEERWSCGACKSYECELCCEERQNAVLLSGRGEPRGVVAYKESSKDRTEFALFQVSALSANSDEFYAVRADDVEWIDTFSRQQEGEDWRRVEREQPEDEGAALFARIAYIVEIREIGKYGLAGPRGQWLVQLRAGGLSVVPPSGFVRRRAMGSQSASDIELHRDVSAAAVVVGSLAITGTPLHQLCRLAALLFQPGIGNGTRLLETAHVVICKLATTLNQTVPSGFALAELKRRELTHTSRGRPVLVVRPDDASEQAVGRDEASGVVHVQTKRGGECKLRIMHCPEALRQAKEEGLCVIRESNESGFRGVHRATNVRRVTGIVHWQAAMKFQGRVTTLGYFSTPEEAALCYSRATMSEWQISSEMALTEKEAREQAEQEGITLDRSRRNASGYTDVKKVELIDGTNVYLATLNGRRLGLYRTAHEAALNRARNVGLFEPTQTNSKTDESPELSHISVRRASDLHAEPELDENGIPLRGSDGEPLSEYERQRLLTIRQNQVMLSSLFGKRGENENETEEEEHAMGSDGGEA